MDYNIKCYSATNKDNNILMKSSSGGVTNAFANEVLKNDGIVIGAAFSENKNSVEYVIIKNQDDLERLFGSKYVWCYPGESLNILYKVLLENPEKMILITGVPCYVDGVRLFLEQKKLNSKNVIFCSLICHGGGSPRLWREYLDLFYKNKKINNISFKDKRNGWEKPTPVINTNRGEESLGKYQRLFNSDNFMRPCCYTCPYATINRECDISIGDFWGIDKELPNYNKYGVSCVFTHSENGERFLAKCSDRLLISEMPIKSGIQKNLRQPTGKPALRNFFWFVYNRLGLLFLIKINEIYFYYVRLKSKFHKVIKKSTRKNEE